MALSVKVNGIVRTTALVFKDHETHFLEFTSLIHFIFNSFTTIIEIPLDLLYSVYFTLQLPSAMEMANLVRYVVYLNYIFLR